jgi:multidrug efflux system membrane fusion protein
MPRLFRIAPVLLLLLVACDREDYVPPPAVPVRTEVIKRSALTPTLTLLGVIRAAQSIPIAAQQGGTIRYPQRFANGLQTGAQIRRGDVIASIENDDVRAAQTEARLQLDAASAELERAERSYQQGVIASAELSERRVRAGLARERFKSASKRMSTLRLLAPATGTLVVSKVYPPGMLVDASSILGEIATAGAPMVESSVAASERASLRPGLPVALIARGSPAWSGKGRIVEVAATVAESGTSRVVAAIDADERTPPPGTGVEVTVQMDPKTSVLSVPEEAIVAGTEGAAVYLAGGSEGAATLFRVKRVAVETGGRAEGRVEITSGLRDGDRVIVGGVEALTDDAVATEVVDRGKG